MSTPRNAAHCAAGTSSQSAGLRIYLLGDFRVIVGERAIECSAWRLRKAGHLVKLLALSSVHRLHRERVMDLLWPDRTNTSAANNLRYALHVARRVLEPEDSRVAPYLRFEGQFLSLAAGGPVWTDVQAFEELAAAAMQQDVISDYYAALALYSGDLLPGDQYDDWVAPRRQALHDTWISLLLRLALLCEKRGEFDPAINALQSVILADPVHEDAHVRLMRLYELAGQRQQALRQYEQLCGVLRQDLDIDPAPASRRLYEELLSYPVHVSPLASDANDVLPASVHQMPGDPATNLPAATSAFIGRAEDISDIERCLSTNRLVTLIGTGGVGKTRLAIEAASRVTDTQPDGVWLVELASLADPELIPYLIASAARIPELGDQPAEAGLVQSLRSRRTLLVLDNCEHLVAGCAALIERLLRACPYLRILATSREVLGVSGEVVWAVAPLAVPASQRPVDLAEVAASEAVRLFSERAQLAQPGFRITEQNASCVASICLQLSGIPLAIELTAARLRVLSLKQIEMRLKDSLQLLVGGHRMAPACQQTLRGAIDWSYALLGSEEKVLFDRLSVFAGGWTLEAAETVCDGGEVVSGDILRVLSQLVDKSLITVEAAGDMSRYSILEPLRQYADERLSASADREPVHVRHAALFVALAERAEPQLIGPGESGWLELLEREHDNLRAVLHWALASGDTETGLRLGSALWLFWYARGHVSEGRRWLARLLSSPLGQPQAATRAKALNASGNLASKQGDYATARAHFEESLKIRRRLADRRGIAGSLNNLGFVSYQQGDYDRAAGLFEEGLAMERELGYQQGAAHALANLGMLADFRGDYETAQIRYRESLELFASLGAEHGVAVSLCYLGNAALAQDDLAMAGSLYHESLTRAQNANARRVVAMSLTGLGLVNTRQEHFAGAQAAFAGSLRLWQEIENTHGIAESLEGFAELAAAQGRYERLLLLTGATETLRDMIGVPRSPAKRARFDQWLLQAHRANDADALTNHRAEGQKMTMEQAISSALADTTPARPVDPLATRSTVAALNSVTPREREVATLVTEGLTNRQIAARLGIGERTVNTHVHNILSRLDLTSRAQIAAWVIRQGLSEPPEDGPRTR